MRGGAWPFSWNKRPEGVEKALANRDNEHVINAINTARDVAIAKIGEYYETVSRSLKKEFSTYSRNANNVVNGNYNPNSVGNNNNNNNY
jgi:hypothetical protein